jgi:hypothetical protein
MMTKSALIFLLLIAGCYTTTHAQFTITGEVRPRAELRNGFKTLKPENTDPAFFVEQRTRVYLDYQRERLRLHASLQDVRIWGNTDQIYKSDPALTNFYEAWGEYNINNRFFFRLGRQAWDYDNARFLGDLDWAQQGRSHDGFLFHCKNPKMGTQLHVGAAYNQNVPFEPARLSGTEYFFINNYKTAQFAWWHKQFGSAGRRLSLLLHNDGRQVRSDTSMAYRQTYAAIGAYEIAGLQLEGEFYFQGGRNADKVQVRAFLLALRATLPTDLTPVTLGFDLLSGTARDDDTDHAFDPLYGTNHKFYGYMDYFYVGNFHGQADTPSGLLDAYVRTAFPLGAKSTIAADVHVFSSPVRLYETAVSDATANRYLGTEADLVYTLRILYDLKLNVGYSHMFGAESLEIIKGRSNAGSVQNWVWAMIAFKPQLFQAEIAGQ